MESSQNANSWNDYFHKESESHGGAFTVNVSHPLAGLYNRNDEFQADDSTPNKRTRTTIYGDRNLLLHSDIKPDEVSSMDSYQQLPESIVGVGDHSNTHHSSNRRENNDHSNDSFMNDGMGAPPWTMEGLGEETRVLESDGTKEESNQSELAPRATSRLVDQRPFSQSLSYLDPNPVFAPPAGLCLGTSEISGHVGSEVNARPTFHNQAPSDHLSLMGMRNDFAAFEISPDERQTGIDFGPAEQQCWGNFSSHSHPGAPKPGDDSFQHPMQHFNGAQLGADMGPTFMEPQLHHPLLNNAAQQSGPHSFATGDHPTQTDPAARPTKMVIGVSHGPPRMMGPPRIMSAPHLHANIQQLVRVQQMANHNFQQLAQLQRFPNATSIMVVDQVTAGNGTNLSFVAPVFGGTTERADSSHEEQDQQKATAVANDKNSSHFQAPQGIQGIPLSLSYDEARLSGYQTLIRRQFEFFVADSEDIQSGGQGRKKKLTLGQVGIRCIHCRHLPWTRRGHAAVYFPSTLEGVYQAAQNMAANHLCGSCHCIPVKLQEKLLTLRKEGTPSSARNGKMYWAEACRAVGVVQTTNSGLRLKRTSAHRKKHKERM